MKKNSDIKSDEREQI